MYIKKLCSLNVSSLCRDKGLCLGKDDVIQVKEAFKWILHSLLSRQLGVPVVSKASASFPGRVASRGRELSGKREARLQLQGLAVPQIKSSLPGPWATFGGDGAVMAAIPKCRQCMARPGRGAKPASEGSHAGLVGSFAGPECRSLRQLWGLKRVAHCSRSSYVSLTQSPLEVSVGFTHPETDGDCHFL